MLTVTRAEVLAHRVRAQQLDRAQGTLADTALLDFGVQDTGPDGAGWALAVRGVPRPSVDSGDLAVLWTLRGAPHAYRRSDLSSVVAAVAPWSDVDAAKRIFDAAKPLKADGIGALAALDSVALTMRDVVTGPMVKGEVSTEVSARLGDPYVRFCRACQATHVHELTFRLGATRAGLELQSGTSPPVLQRIPRLSRRTESRVEHDVVRGYLHFLGPATVRQVAEFIDSPAAEVKAHWPTDAVEVDLAGESRWMLEGDLDGLGGDRPRTTRLLGPYDLFGQGRDRDLLVADPARRKTLWPVLGRPGTVLEDGEIVGTWRPRAAGKRLTVAVQLWRAASAARRKGIAVEAERLAAHRGVELRSLDLT